MQQLNERVARETQEIERKHAEQEATRANLTGKMQALEQLLHPEMVRVVGKRPWSFTDGCCVAQSTYLLLILDWVV